MWDETGDADGSGGDAARADAEPVRPAKSSCKCRSCNSDLLHRVENDPSLFFSCGTVVRVHHGMCCIQGLTELAFRFAEQHGVLHSDVSSETDACE